MFLTLSSTLNHTRHEITYTKSTRPKEKIGLRHNLGDLLQLAPTRIDAIREAAVPGASCLACRLAHHVQNVFRTRMPLCAQRRWRDSLAKSAPESSFSNKQQIKITKKMPQIEEKTCTHMLLGAPAGPQHGVAQIPHAYAALAPAEASPWPK